MIKIARLTWDSNSYKTGIDRGVFYPLGSDGQVWNGLISIDEIPLDSKEQIRYIDGIKTHRRRRLEDFAGVIRAFTYPDMFYKTLLTNVRNTTFGLSYRINKDNGYEIHLVYNVIITPSSIQYLQNDSEPFSWNFTTIPVPVPGVRSSAHLIIDTNKAYVTTIVALEDILYGSDEEIARLPSPQEIFDIFEINSILKVIDHGDGTFTVDGPDSAIEMIDSTTFQITWPSAIYIDSVSYQISSL